MKLDPIAKYFVEVRNNSIHKGHNPLGQVTLEHLREDLFQQFSAKHRSHILILPDVNVKGGTVLGDAVQASTSYFSSLVEIIFDCYDRFRYVVDPRWYFTHENFESRGKTIEDALEELGFPRTWLSSATNVTDAWRVLRSQQPECLVNDLFHRYAGRTLPNPDQH